MNSKRRNIVLCFIAGIVVLVGIGLVYQRRHEKKFTIAINLPLSGPIAAFMGPYPDALQMGLEDGFQRLGMPIDSFHLDVQDNAGKPSQALSVVQQQILRGFDIYISGSSEMTTAILPEVDARNVPHFLIAFDAYMTSKGPNRLRILPHYKLEGPQWVEYVKQRGAKRAALLTLNNAPIEEEFTDIVEPGLKNLGVEFKRERFEWTGSDYRTLALKVQSFKPDVILVNGYSVHLYPIISALRSLNLVRGENVLASLDFDDLLYNGTPGQDLVGVAFITPVFEVTAADNRQKEWKQRFESRFDKRATYVAAYAYDTGVIIAKAASRTPAPSKKDIVGVLPYDGVAGRISLDAVGDLDSTLVLAKLNSAYAPVRLFP